MMLTVQQVAEKLGFSEEKVRRMCGEGKLPAVNTAAEGSTRTSWKFDDKALREWRAAQRSGSNGNHAEAAPVTTTGIPDGYMTAEEASPAQRPVTARVVPQPEAATPGRMLRLLEEIAERTARVEAALAALQKMWT